MAILIDELKRVIVQGITGREGQARTRLMLGYGTNVVAGCTPAKGGEQVQGVPVFDKVGEAMAHSREHCGGDVDISVVLVPARFVKGAAIESIEAGVKLLVIVPDRVPVWDAMEIAAAAKDHGAQFVGPNTLGIISPGKAVVGMIGGRAESVVDFNNGRGTAEQWIKEGKHAIRWTRLSCHGFDANQARLQLHVLAYNLGKFLRRPALPRAVKHWSLTTLRDKLIKIGAKVVHHARYVTFQLAEVAVPRWLFRAILDRIQRFAALPPRASPI